MKNVLCDVFSYGGAVYCRFGTDNLFLSNDNTVNLNVLRMLEECNNVTYVNITGDSVEIDWLEDTSDYQFNCNYKDTY